MRALFAKAGIDYDQWKALTRTALKLDFRLASFGQSRMNAQVKGASVFLAQGVLYFIFGVFLSILVWASRDLFLIGSAMTTYTLFMVGTAVLLDHSSALTSPADYSILGFRPVSSRTYFASRLANVLAYTTGMTTLVVILPVLALFLRHGLLVGLAGVLACYGCSISATLAILLSYTGMMRLVGADTLKRALSYVQLVMSFLVYGGYIFVSQFVSKIVTSSFVLPKSPWLLLYPGTWFASYLDIAAGKTSALELVPAGASVVAMVAMASGLSGRLSLDYSERLGAISASSQRATAAKTPVRPGFWFRSGEGRAMALLIRSQFRNDQRFRMSVLGILPLTLLYVFMAVRDGGMVDPFVPLELTGRRGGPTFSLVTMAIMMFPTMLKVSLSHSDTFRASWIFFACPADRLRMVRSSRSVLVTFFLLPYLLFVTAIYAYMIGNIFHAAVHMALLGLFSFLCLELVVFIDPELPFSRPPQKGKNSTLTIVLIFSIVILTSILGAFSAEIYSSFGATVLVYGLVIAACAAVDRLTRARVERQVRKLEFLG